MRTHIAERRRELAEDCCRDLRRVLTMRVCDRTQEDWTGLLKRLQQWMKAAGKSGYDLPR